MTKTEKELELIVKPTIEQLGYELYDIEYLKEGSEWFLRIYIDSLEKSIDLDDCEKVSNAISDILDEKDPISSAYNLEVSSCGLERNLREIKHFESAIGKRAEFKLFKQLNNNKSYTGEIKKVTNESVIILDDNNSEVVLYLSDISSAKTLFNWEE